MDSNESTSRRRIGGADLHVHTNRSDGSSSPADVVVAAARLRLAALAITDHDTVAAVGQAQVVADAWDVELIAGTELSTRDDQGHDTHLLGHFLDLNASGLHEHLDQAAKARATRAHEIVSRLQSLGYRIELESLLAGCRPGAVGRRHIADYLVRTRQIQRHAEAFAGLLDQGGMAYVGLELITTTQAIELIHDAGGTAALPHPTRTLNLATLTRWKDAGLDALEWHFPGCPAARRARLQRWADQLDLVPIAGSDYHQPGGHGPWVGCITTAPAELEALRARRRQVGTARHSAKTAELCSSP